MANESVTLERSAKESKPDIADRIYVGSGRGPNPIHKVGSAKQYATKSTGKVCNQAKFPTGNKTITAARKKD